MRPVRKYFQPEKASETPNWGVTIHDLGHHIHPARVPYPDRNHPSSHYFDFEKGRILQEFQLLYIAHGSGIFEAENFAATQVEAGTVFLLFPNVWHRYKPLETTGWEEFWVGFQGTYVDFLMQQGCFSPRQPILEIGLSNELLHIFSQLTNIVLTEESAEKDTLRSCLTIQLLSLIYASALLQQQKKQSLVSDSVIQKARFIIHDHAEQQLDVPKLAEKLNVGYAWFRKEFKNVVGVSPGQYHLNVRIQQAKKLLRDTDLPIGQIAYRLSFESEFYFSRIFKTKTGVAASQYRLDSKNQPDQ
jgi:AraC-like DNA-binding protein